MASNTLLQYGPVALDSLLATTKPVNLASKKKKRKNFKKHNG